MCFNPVKALPYAVGGLVGGSMLKSAFGGKKAKASTAEPAATSTAGTIGPSPSYGS
jgi:hypothetical protein